MLIFPKLKIFFPTFLLLFSYSLTYGQLKLPEWEAGFSPVGGLGDQTPFWIISNREGRFLPEKNSASMEIAFVAERDTGKVVDYDYGLELYGRAGSSNDVWLHQGYAGVTFYDFLRLRAGMQSETAHIAEPAVSSGSIMWSGNARPMPKVEIATPGFVDVPYTDGLVEIRGLISHGWFEEGRYASDVWLHHKNAHMRVGGSFPVNVYYGLDHYAKWGGSSPRQEEPYPSDLEAFSRVFFISSAPADDPGSPEGWEINKIGDHLGSRTQGIDLNLDNLSAGIYLQDIMEDGSGWRRQNFPDGLWGAWVRFDEEKKPVQSIVYEYLHTTHQSGEYHDIDGDTLGGRDNYFNHGHYQSGWTYHEYTIGTPLITSPLLNDPASHRIRNNRVRAHHVGVKGYITQNIAYRNFFTYSRNYGTYSRPYEPRRDQFSWMLELSTPLDFFDLEANVTFAADIGDMYGNNFGMLFKLIKRGGF